MRKFALCTIFLILLVSFSGCTMDVKKRPEDREPMKTDEKSIIIGVTVQDLSNEYITMIKDAIYEKLAEYDDVILLFEDAEAKPYKQIVQMETFIAQKVDAIIVNPADGEMLIPAIEDAIAEDIPVITLSSDVDMAVGQYWSGSENVIAGEKQAEYICKLLGGKGYVAILRGPDGHFCVEERYKGYMNILKQYPEIRIIFDQSGNWQREQGMSIMEKWIDSGAQIDAIISQNDAMILGAIQAIKNAGMEGEILTAGIDAIDEALDAVKRGELNATCFQDAKGQAYNSLDMAVFAAKGNDIKNIIIPFELVTKENVNEYYKKVISMD